MLAFPTAEGWGAQSIGGRGGVALFVDNGNDDGPGSFRAAVQDKRPRYVLPRFSGTGRVYSSLTCTTPFITIAGQYSPGGFQLRGPNNGNTSGLMFLEGCHNIIVRHLRPRFGGPGPDDQDFPLGTYSIGQLVRAAIFDHCSAQWNSEAVQAYGASDEITFQHCIVAEGANNTSFASRIASKGFHFQCGRITDHHNLLAMNAQRNPLCESAWNYDMRNNLVYGWGGNNAGQFGLLSKNMVVRGNVINNLYIPGPESGLPNFWVANGDMGGGKNNLGYPIPQYYYGGPGVGTRLYTRGNWGPARPNGPSSELDDFLQFSSLDWEGAGLFPVCDPAIYRLAQELDAPPVRTDPTSALEDIILANVGANRPYRDAADQRVINAVRSRTAPLLAGAGYENGNWPDLATNAPPLPTDSNQDGVSDQFAASYGYGPMDPCANVTDVNSGYPIIEMYLNTLGGDFDPPGTIYIDDPVTIPLIVPDPVQVASDPPALLDHLPDSPAPGVAVTGRLMLPRSLSNPEWVQFQKDVDVPGLNLPPWGGVVHWIPYGDSVTYEIPVLVYQAPGGLFLTDVSAIMNRLNIAPAWEYAGSSWLWRITQPVFKSINSAIAAVWKEALAAKDATVADVQAAGKYVSDLVSGVQDLETDAITIGALVLGFLVFGEVTAKRK